MGREGGRRGKEGEKGQEMGRRGGARGTVSAQQMRKVLGDIFKRF